MGKSHVILFSLWVLLSCTLSWISCSWFTLDPNISEFGQFWTFLLYLPSYEFLLSNFSIILIMHWQQQECSSYSFVSGILHSYTEANHLHGNMCRHIHISLIISCLQCHELSSLSFHSHIHLCEDDIVSVLQLVK